MTVLRIASRDLFVVDLDSEIQLTWPEFSRIFSRQSSKSWVLRDGALAQMGGGAGGASAWGDITGTITNQIDLNNSLNGKVATNDSRLSDARTPLAHGHAPGDVTGTAVITNDARLSDARTPLAHSHAETDVTNLVTDLGNKQATLVSSTNIKTINGSSVLGSGDLVVTGAQPDVPVTKLAPTADVTIPAGYSAVVIRRYTIALGTKLIIGLGARFQIL